MPDWLNDLWDKYSTQIVSAAIGAAVVAVVALFHQLLVGAVGKAIRWLWSKLPRKPTLPQAQEPPFLYATSFADLERRIQELVPELHGDLGIPYLPRLPEAEQRQLQAAIDSSQLLLLVGRTGIGKTREAIEALRRREQRLGEPLTILVPTRRFTGPFALPPGLPTHHLVLFIDNLHNRPYYAPDREGASAATAEDFPTWLRACLTYFKGYPDFRVIATVRNDLQQRDYEETIRRIRPMLDQEGFRQYPLPSWGRGNLEGLISAMASGRRVTVPEDANRELTRRCADERTPEYARVAVGRVSEGSTLTLQEVQALPSTLGDLWQDTWNQRIAPYPARAHLFHALALLREAGLTPYREVALELAARLWGRPWWWRRRRVGAALPAVSAWIEPKATTLECPEAYLPEDIVLAQPGRATLVGRTLLDLFPKAPAVYAPELGNLGIFLQQFPLGERAQNLEEAIACYSRALEVYTRQAFPQDWAMTQNNLGAAYRNRIQGERAQNLEEAIACYHRALEVRTRQAFPQDWAATQNNLGAAYGDRIQGERAQNLEGAIARFSPVMQALEGFIARGGLVLGICNGFQILCEAQLLPGVLMRNSHLQFRNQWVHIRVETTETPFTQACQRGQVLRIPISHGEGNYYADEETLKRLEAKGQIVFRYSTPQGAVTPEANPNGSLGNIAGIVNERGNVLGMMPHPERCVEGLVGGTDGRALFASLLKSAMARMA